MTSRSIVHVSKSRPTLEGAGVHLKRAFGNQLVPKLDPFLLLDDFHSHKSSDFIKGFPWHPHRGIETISYVLAGEVEHGDSMGNRGVVGPGDVQWMTAGSGIVHQEMPRGGSDGMLWGFQLWANLPAAKKMMHPRYQDVRRDQIPEVTTSDGASVKVICGTVDGVNGPVQDIVTDPAYLDVSVPSEGTFIRAIPAGYTAFAYVIEGAGSFGSPAKDGLDAETLVVFGDGDRVEVRAGSGGVRFLLVSGKPIGEPIAWGGPIVMNTDEELRIAFEELEKGTFLKA